MRFIDISFATLSQDAGITLAAMDATAHTVPKEYSVEVGHLLNCVPFTCI